MKYKCQNCGEELIPPDTHSCVLIDSCPNGVYESLETADDGDGGIDQMRIKRTFSNGNLSIEVRMSTPSEIQQYLNEIALANQMEV